MLIAISFVIAWHIAAPPAVRPVFADDIGEHNKCLRAIRYYERKYNIPKDLLYSISVIESGKWLKTYNDRFPWPWALNVEGKPYYFSSKEETLDFLAEKLSQGVNNIDVGCSQINLRHHGDNFNRLEQILNPNYNVAYAAYFLSRNYEETDNWNKAVAHYHSRNKALGNKYLNKVKEVWQSLTNTHPKVLNNKKRRSVRNVQKKKERRNQNIKDNIIVYERNSMTNQDGQTVLQKDLQQTP